MEHAPKHLAMLVDRSRPNRRFDLEGTVLVGRAQNSQIVLSDAGVSREHAWIRIDGKGWSVVDAGSTNGTYVNDERVENPRRLVSGDVVRFGNAEFAFTIVF